MWKQRCTQTRPLPPTSKFYSVSGIVFCEGPLFVVLQVHFKEAPSSGTCSTALAQSLTQCACGGLQEVFNLQDAACARAPEPQHLPCFTEGLISTSAFPLMSVGKLNIWSQAAHVPAAANVAAARVLQSFWGPFQCSSTGRRKVRTCDVACGTRRLFRVAFKTLNMARCKGSFNIPSTSCHA